MVGVIPGSTTTTASSGYINTNTSGNFSVNAYGAGGALYGSGSYSGYGATNYYGTETTTTAPELYTYNVPYTKNVHQYQVAFLRKLKPPVLGIGVFPIPEEMRAELGRNTGAYVSLVRNGSPAFRGNVLIGDVLIGVGDKTIDTVDDVRPAVLEYAEKEVALKIIRAGQEILVSVRLNKSQGVL